MPEIKFPPVLDISHWIEVDDFNALSPKPWLILTKATQGEYFIDSQVAEYADEIRDAGIRLGLYHWIDPGDEWKQADHFCEIIMDIGLTGNEVLVCDLEVKGVNLAQVRNFLDRVQQKTGIRPIIYTSEIHIEDLYPSGVCPMWLKAEWLWIAEYPSNVDAVDFIPSWIIPHGLTVSNIALWQYTDDGVITGIPGNNVDLNLINPQYLNFIKLTEPGEPIPPAGETMQGTIKSLTNIRNGAGVGFNDIGDLHAGDIVTSDRTQDVSGVKWYHLTNATRNNQPIITLGGLNVSQRTDCWAYGPNIEPIGEPEPESGFLPLDINITENAVTISGPNVQTVSVELRPKV